jgi:hypothetical protein
MRVRLGVTTHHFKMPRSSPWRAQVGVLAPCASPVVLGSGLGGGSEASSGCNA